MLQILNMDIIIHFIYLLSVVSIYTTEGWGIGSDYKHFKEQLQKFATALDVSNVTEKWIEQPIDHFNKHDKRIWKMKYYESLEFWKPGGAIYIFIGGEWSVSAHSIVGSYVYTLANETNGAIIASEHRYYGQSQPLNNSSVEDLKYLSSEQALADLAHLIRTIKSSAKFKHSKVAVVGGSYAGNLAAWMRLKYPDIVDAAWASSGPVLAKKDYYEFIQTIAKDLKRDNPERYKRTIRNLKKYDTLLKTPEGIQRLKKQEDICIYVDMEDPLNKASFMFSKLHEGFDMHVAHKKSCNDYRYQIAFTELFDTGTWLYQSCTEFGYFKTSRPYSDYVTVDFYLKACSTYFGPNFNENRVDEGVAYTNKQYGGLTPNVTKVVYVYGGRDAWRSLGILKNLSEDAVSRIIPHGHHCDDILPSRPDDSAELTEARKYITNHLKNWLGIHK